MAVKITDMMGRTKTIQVEWDGETVDVSYFHNVVTPEHLENVAQAADKEDLSVLGVMLEPVLDWWDILQDDGTRLPTDADTIRRVPMSFLNALNKAIEEAQNPPEGSSSDAS
jgi:hypothetical protein